MRIPLIILLTSAGYALSAQMNVDEKFALEGYKKIELNFKWPKLVKVQNWEGDEVKITGSVLINNGEGNDSFRLKSKSFDDELVIQSEIENIDDLPKKIMIKRDGMSYYFNTQNWHDPEVQKFMNEEGHRANEYVTMGVIKEIELHVYVPKGIDIVINSKYGLVEIDNILNHIEVNAKYGGIDMVCGTSKKNLEARTRYGEIYSDLPFDLLSKNGEFQKNNKWTVVTSKGGSGQAVLESKYGSVFLRQKRGG